MTQAPIQNVQTQQPAAPEQQPVTSAQQPVNNYYVQSMDAPLSVGNYLVMFLLMGIPFANMIVLFIWAFGNGVNQNRKNYARAMLILWLIAVVIFTVFFIFAIMLSFNNYPARMR